MGPSTVGRGHHLSNLITAVPGLPAASPRQRDELLRTLSKLDSALLRWFSQQGLKLVVVPAKADLEKTPLVRHPLDEHDQETLQAWREDELNGQFLYPLEPPRLLVHERALSSQTPLHELGHALEFLLQRQHPELHQEMCERRDFAFAEAQRRGSSVSRYALSQVSEFWAEGFGAYYLEPEDLQKRDPELYKLVDSVVARVSQNQGIDLKTGRTVRQNLERLPTQLEQAKSQSPQELNHILKAIQTHQPRLALEAVQHGLMGGAAQALLGQPLHLSLQPSSDLDLEQAASGSDVKQAFELGWQHGYFSANP